MPAPVVLGRLFAALGHYYPWASPDYLLWHMTPEQVFHYYDMMVWNETGEPPAQYADAVHKTERRRIYPELAPGLDGKPRVLRR